MHLESAAAMIDAGLVVATFALVMVVWNIGLAKKSMHEVRGQVERRGE